MSDDKLLPCPWCQNTERFSHWANHLMCDVCQSMGPRDVDDHVAAWNTRTSNLLRNRLERTLDAWIKCAERTIEGNEQCNTTLISGFKIRAWNEVRQWLAEQGK